MQVTDLKIESNMKEELLEAIYGTVERLEQKVDELSVTTKNAGAETVLALQVLTQANLKKPFFLHLQEKRKLLENWQN